MKLMLHDDDCGIFLDAEGECPACGFHPDMQSTGFAEVPDEAVKRNMAGGRTYLGVGRKPIRSVPATSEGPKR